MNMSLMPIVSGIPEDVKTILDKVSATDVVKVVSAQYPQFDHPLLSKVKHGDQTGIRLLAEAEKLVLDEFVPKPTKRRRKARRNKPKRISCRLTETIYGTLQRHTEQLGVTMQTFIENLIIKELNKEIDHGNNV